MDKVTKFIPVVGKDRGGHGAGPGHHDRLEAHRRNGRRKDRQGAPDLRAGRIGGTGRYGEPSWPPTNWAYPSAPRTCFPRASREPWPPMDRDCRWTPFVTYCSAWVLTLPVCVILGAGIFAFGINVLFRMGIK